MNPTMRGGVLALLVSFGLTWSRLHGEEPVDYLREIKPLLAEKCLTCHGALRQKGELRLDTVSAMREGGESGPALVPGQSDQSLLIARVLGRKPLRQMPPATDGEPLGSRQIALLKRWIDQGAAGPSDEKPEPDPRRHWAFQPPVRPLIPEVKHLALVRNPIDSFVVASYEQHGLIPQSPADRRTLLRRLTLDLIGLPPTRAEQEAFVAGSATDALDKVVERLLASPQYGERWGRHWMDLWRYSDWWGLGQEIRNSQKHIWHWRDWIIEALNADKGYDQMILEMFAADELYPNDLSRLRATGLLARSYFLFNRTTWLDEVIEHTSKAFLGLTMNCCKCHDHKYDPVSQIDYYRLRAFFEPYQLRLEQVPGETDYQRDAIPRAYDCNLDAPTYLFVRGDERNPLTGRRLTPALPAVLTWATLEIRPVVLPTEARAPGLRPHVLQNYLSAEQKKLEAARALLEKAQQGIADPKSKALRHEAEKMRVAAEAQITALKSRAEADRRYLFDPAKQKDLANLAALAERRADLARAEEELARAEKLETLERTDSAKKPALEKALTAARDAVTKARKALERPGTTYTPLRGALKSPEQYLEPDASRNRPFPATSTGRRNALAHWMSDRRNPLTARVAVNHIWARHFGRPLVATVFDFGRKGSPPANQALLDYLAVDFMEHGWSMKYLHRLIVTSATYQLSSSSAGADPKTRADDPENRYCWRQNSIRMEAEVLRDSLLSLAGALDTEMGGPPIPVREEQSRRRSLYFFHSHNEEQRFLSVFDNANVLQCYRRTESIVPQQALALANSKLTLDMAARIADHLSDEAKADAEFIRAAFEAVLAARPTAEELAACEQAIQRWRELGRTRPDGQRRARSNLVHALLNHNDFITIR
jgi:hypothetical protein